MKGAIFVMKRTMNKNRHYKRNKRKFVFRLVVCTLFVVSLGIGWGAGKMMDVGANTLLPSFGFAERSAEEKIADFAKKNDLDVKQWPKELIEMLENNPETEEFVLEYPLRKDDEPTIDLSEYENTYQLPLLFQWDLRWGYYEYGGEVMGLSGCGPTCLSMVCIYLKHNADYHPRYIAQFAKEHGYDVEGSGSSWDLISQGGKELGLDVIEIPLDENRVIENLKVHNPIICVMGPGDFTTTGHFIVLTEYKEGKIAVHDPNSKARSEKLWYFDDIKNQIRNLWVCR